MQYHGDRNRRTVPDDGSAEADGTPDDGAATPGGDATRGAAPPSDPRIDAATLRRFVDNSLIDCDLE